MSASRAARSRPVIVAGCAALAVAVVGGLMTDIGPWYARLVQPAWKPPDWAFGPIWTVIFALAAAAGVTGWRQAAAHPGTRFRRETLLLLFAVNGFLNVLWSLLYFRLRRPDWALIEVPILWLSILALIGVLSRYAPRAAWLLVPYLAWVAVAAALNWQTVRLNGPFA